MLSHPYLRHRNALNAIGELVQGQVLEAYSVNYATAFTLTYVEVMTDRE